MMRQSWEMRMRMMVMARLKADMYMQVRSGTA